jgi:hypothetical protein
MKDLNEKLAVEVMGWLDGKSDIWQTHKKPSMDGWKFMDDRHIWWIERTKWNPTTDLNQLRECYLALSEDKRTLFSHIALTMYLPTIFANPELVAQAILKAKGVE